MTDTKTQLPMGKLGNLDVSRLILGGNLLALYHHCRDQNYVYNLVKHYNTEEKLLETFEIAEANGINTMTVHTFDWTLDIFKKHRDRGGKMQWVFCPTAEITDDLQVYKDEIARLVDLGANAFHVWGEHTDVLLREGKVDVIAELMGIIRSHGVPVGVGAHDINVTIAVEERGFDPDFYVKTFHHHDYPTCPTDPAEKVDAYTEVPGYWDRDPDKTREVMSKITKPWIAFKTMAAGTIHPESAFQFAYEGGADFIYAGMFDYDIEEDVELATRIITDLQANGRDRDWM